VQVVTGGDVTFQSLCAGHSTWEEIDGLVQN
jgi:hypothetical protein